MMLVWFTRVPNAALMFEVQKAGHLCVQAGTEALLRGVVVQYPENGALIGPDISQSEAREVRQHYPTMHLTQTRCHGI